MGLSGLLARWAVRSVSVLVVEVPGWGLTRCAVEAELRRRGWRAALSPADADALVVCGAPGDDLRAAVDLVWDQLPGPRARADVHAVVDVPTALDGVRTSLADDAGQRREAAARSTDLAAGTTAPGGEEVQPSSGEDSGDGSGDEDDGGMAGMDHGDMDHGDMDMDMDMDGMDMDGMDMPMPSGIPLAGGAQDRDGLEMDVLHVPLGPVLAAWPAGLVLRCTLSGDIVTEAHAQVLEAAGPPPDGEGLRPGSAAERLDRAGRTATVAGWEAVAVEAGRLRDELLFSDSLSEQDVRARLDRLTRRVESSRMLRWSMSDGAGPDPHQRLCRLLDAARRALGEVAPGDAAPPLAEPPPEDLSLDLSFEDLSFEGLAREAVGRQLATVHLLAAGTAPARQPARTGAA